MLSWRYDGDSEFQAVNGGSERQIVNDNSVR